MRRLFLSCVFTFFTIIFSFAQSNPKTILWEVSGNGLKQSSYVLGTFHILCEEDLVIREKVQRAIQATEQLTLEVNLTDPNEFKDIQTLLVTENPLSAQLSIEEINELKVILKKEYGKELKEVDNMSMFGLMSLMIGKTITCSAKGFDMEILQLAIKNGNKIVGLEHLNDQIKLLDKLYSVKEIVEQLKKVDSYVDNYNEMKQAFVNEDIDALYIYGTDSEFMSAEAKKELLDNRNSNWLNQMPRMMLNKPTLFAVGSAHLGGEKGVLNLLKEKGYKITPILN
jgi:uncharacterized protein YbaP (TraB family)